ncbi:MAG: aldose epimerase family protein [Steroidobacteraceae bacterium]
MKCRTARADGIIFWRLTVGAIGSFLTAHALAANVSREPYGVTAAGEQVEVFTLQNDRGMRVKVLSFGGILNEIVVPDKRGSCDNVALSLPDLAAYEGRPSFSSLLGRYANRIASGGFTIDGIRYDLKSNASGVSSHGGERGFGARNWSGQPFRAGQTAGVVLEYHSADGENGFPGALVVQVRYTLDEDNSLLLEYSATTDKPTVLNLSHHVYFNLSGETTIYDHRAQVFADRYTQIDTRKVPTGRIETVAGTSLDLRRPTRLGDRIQSKDPQMALGNGFDHNFVLSKPPGAFARAARIEAPATGRILEVSTTEPGMQLYTGNGFNGSLRDDKGRPIVQGAGLALETQHFPDSPNQPSFPSTVLRPGQVFKSATQFSFEVAGQSQPGRCTAADAR